MRTEEVLVDAPWSTSIYIKLGSFMSQLNTSLISVSLSDRTFVSQWKNNTNLMKDLQSLGKNSVGIEQMIVHIFP